MPPDRLSNIKTLYNDIEVSSTIFPDDGSVSPNPIVGTELISELKIDNSPEATYWYQDTRMIQTRDMTDQSRGLTLIELMITVVILGIIAAVAVPAYNQYIENARRADARLALLQLSNEMEKFYSNNLEYPDSFGQIGMTSVSPDGFYDLSLTTNAVGYTLTATAKSDEAQASDTHCASFTLDSSGEEGGTHDNCW